MPKGIYAGNKGRKHTEEARRKMKIKRAGRKPALGKHWNLSEETKIRQGLWQKNKAVSEKEKQRLKTLNLGRKHTEQSCKNMGLSRKGKKLGEDARRNMSLANKKRVLQGTHHWWKGGVSSKNNIIRHSTEYKIWRTAVFKRDNYTCIWGGKEHGKDINADHIKPFSLYPELRFAIDNGRTLCVECHKTTETYPKNLIK